MVAVDACAASLLFPKAATPPNNGQALYLTGAGASSYSLQMSAPIMAGPDSPQAPWWARRGMIASPATAPLLAKARRGFGHHGPRASVSASTQDAVSERTRGHDAMSERHTHTCQERARERTLPRVSARASARAHNATTNVMWFMIPHNNPPQHLKITFHMI